MSTANILVVDDSSTIRQQVSAALGPAGFGVVEAVDGEDALRKLDSSTGLAMILCDVNMPKMGGLEMLAEVKQRGRHSHLPIIMLTTEGQPELVARARTLGAKGWIVKPFKPALLAATVKKLTGR
jgi:two-component system, chemotaxis family, chemotaxis protein CheY